MPRKTTLLLIAVLLGAGLLVAFPLAIVPCVDTVCGNFNTTISDKTVVFEGFASGGTPPYLFFWDFGDMNTRTDPADPTEELPVIVSHTYESYGTYTVTMRVSDADWDGIPGEGDNDVAFVTKDVVVAAEGGLVAAFTWKNVGATEIAYDASATGGTPPYTWAWRFGDDGDSAFDDSFSQAPVHDFGKEGTWLSSVKVTDSDGAFNVYTEQVSIAATKIQVGIDIISIDGLTIKVEAVVTGGVPPYLTYIWKTGDGREITGQTRATWTYGEPGTYTVTLFVRDSAFQEETAWRDATVTGPTIPPPTDEAFSVDFDVITRDGLVVEFAITINGGTSPYEFLWDFGDGETSMSRSPAHEYPEDGQYTVTLTVTDSNGEKATSSDSVSVLKDVSTREMPLGALVFSPFAIILLVVGAGISLGGSLRRGKYRIVVPGGIVLTAFALFIILGLVVVPF